MNPTPFRRGIEQIGNQMQFTTTLLRSGSAGAERKVIDGPFTETKELVAGYWLWQVSSLEEAIEWLKRGPNPHPDATCEVEIRPLLEACDLE